MQVPRAQPPARRTPRQPKKSLQRRQLHRHYHAAPSESSDEPAETGTSQMNAVRNHDAPQRAPLTRRSGLSVITKLNSVPEQAVPTINYVSAVRIVLPKRTSRTGMKIFAIRGCTARPPSEPNTVPPLPRNIPVAACRHLNQPPALCTLPPASAAPSFRTSLAARSSPTASETARRAYQMAPIAIYWRGFT